MSLEIKTFTLGDGVIDGVIIVVREQFHMQCRTGQFHICRYSPAHKRITRVIFHKTASFAMTLCLHRTAVLIQYSLHPHASLMRVLKPSHGGLPQGNFVRIALLD